MASSSLFKDQAKFAKRQADATNFLVSTEKRHKNEKAATQKATRPKPTLGRSKTSSDFLSDQRPSTTSTKSNFLLLATIVEKLQETFLGGKVDPLTLDEIIAETHQAIDAGDRYWLASKALLNNPKINVQKVDDVNKFVYKPPLDLKGPKKQSLLNLLKTRHENCAGAVTVDDVRDSVPSPRADLIMESLIKSGDVVKITSNKKEILFYTDRAHDLRVNAEFIDAWRKTSVEGLDNEKILKVLAEHGHKGLNKKAPLRAPVPIKSRRGGRRNDTMKQNLHVASQLEDYSNMTIRK